MFGVQSFAVSDGDGVNKIDTTAAPAPVTLATFPKHCSSCSAAKTGAS
jgi:hypothetical protein